MVTDSNLSKLNFELVDSRYQIVHDNIYYSNMTTHLIY